MFDIIIIGGGPIGMVAAIEFAQLNHRVLLIEASEMLGGQLTTLYPEKEIVDIPHITCIRAKDYIISLEEEIKALPLVSILTNEKMIDLQSDGLQATVKTNRGKYECKYVIIACGLGAFVPRTMQLESESHCKNILYSLQDMSQLKNKKVLVMGGGDSALDWTKEISRISNEVTIIHRRNEFRGNFETIANIENIRVKTPYIPVKINMKNNLLTSLVIKKIDSEELLELSADFVFVNYGYIPQADHFNLEGHDGGLKVDSNMKTKHANIFAIGDIARYEGKARRIAPGLEEITKIIKIINK